MDVAVVGAGLAGLTAAYQLSAAGCSVRVIEARSRVGGRIWTVEPAGLGTSFDLGATWHWSDQTAIGSLAADLGLSVFPQFRSGRALTENYRDGGPELVDLDPPFPAELRFRDGAQDLCRRLADGLPAGSMDLDTTVESIENSGTGVVITTNDANGDQGEVRPGVVIVAVPPRLAHDRIIFNPRVPADLGQVMAATPTWMGRALKCLAVYDTAFWRQAGLSGQAFSTVGPLLEVHDAGSADGDTAALWGFVSADHAFRDLDGAARAEQVLAQLSRLFGPSAADPIAYFERDWSADPNTADRQMGFAGTEAGFGHPAFGQPLWEGRLVWAGAETVTVGGGHMEGAVRSGLRAARMVLGGAR